MRPLHRGLAALLALLIPFASAARAGDVLAFLRLESLDAAAADAEALARAAGADFQRDAVVARALAAFGISDASLLDAARPMAVALPVEGMALKTRGLVAVLPVRSTTETLDRIARQFKTRSVEGAVHSFSTFSGPSLYARAEAPYLILGQSRDLVAGFDLGAVLRWGGPAGSLQVEVFLDPVVPTIQAGLQKTKEDMKAQLRQHANTPDGTTPSAEGMDGVFDFYFDLARAVLSNVTRVQTALGRTAEHAVLRHRLLARSGSALAEFGAAQKPSSSRLPCLLDPAAAVALADVTVTPPFRALLKDLARRYLAVSDRLVREARKEAESGSGSLADFWTALAPEAGRLAERWVECLRGDYAASFDLTDRLSFTQAWGHHGGDSCRTLGRDGARALRAALARLPEGDRFLTVEEGLTAGSVTAQSVKLDVPALLRMLAAPEPEDPNTAPGGSEPTDRFARFLYGDGAYPYLWADLGDASLYLGGASAEARLRRLVDAGAERSSAGVGSEAFAPLDGGPGLSWALDLGRLLLQAQARLSAEERAQLDGAARALSGGGARLAARVSFDSSGIGVQLALPLKLAELVRTLAPPALQEEAPEEPVEPEQELLQEPEREPTAEEPPGDSPPQRPARAISF